MNFRNCKKHRMDTTTVASEAEQTEHSTNDETHQGY